MSDDRLQGLLDALPHGLCETDAQGIITHTNTVHDRLLGRPRGTFTGSGLGETIADTALRRRFLEATDRALRARRGMMPPQSTLLPMRHADGHLLQVKVDWTVRHDGQGRPQGITCVLTDVTDSLHSEAALAATQRLARVGDWQYDPRQARLTWSSEVSRIFGLPLDHCCGDTDALLAAVHPEDRRDKLRALHGLLRNGGHYRMTYRLAAAKGRPRLVEEQAEALRDESGAIVLLRGVVQDVTTLRQAAERARDSAARLEQALRLGHMGVWDWWPDHGRLWVSDEARTLFGLPASDAEDPEAPATAATVLAHVHPDDRPTLEMLIDSLTPFGGPATCEFRLRRPDGEERILRAEAECLHRLDGTRIVRGVCRDVTENRRHDAALEATVARGRQSVAAATALVSTLAHDLRGPLARIADYADLLEHGRAGPVGRAAHGDICRAIGQTSRQLTEAADDILDLVALESGTLDLQLDTLAPAGLVAEAVRRLTAGTPDLARRLVIDAADDLLPVEADARRLRRALFLLLHRALRRAPAGQPVHLSMRQCGTETAEITLFVPAGTGGRPAKPPGLDGWESAIGDGRARDLLTRLVDLHGGTLSLDDPMAGGTLHRLSLPSRLPARRPSATVVAMTFPTVTRA